MRTFACCLMLLMSGVAFADVRLPAVISDHMVLQAGKPAVIWGWADAGEQVTVSIAGQSRTAAPDAATKKWSVKLDPLTAGDQPLTLTITGRNTVTVRDVLVGEVWLGSGQSNMAMLVRNVRDAEREMAAADFPRIRYFQEESPTAATPQDGGKGQWVLITPETVGRASATLYFTARDLHQALGVPVGIINSSVGGTPIEAWIDAEAQRSRPEFAGFFDLHQQSLKQAADPRLDQQYQKELARWQQEAAAAKKAGKRLCRKPVPVRRLFGCAACRASLACHDAYHLQVATEGAAGRA